MPNNGFLYVATTRKGYYRAAKNSVISLRDYYPDAKIAFFTHAEWVTPEDHEIFDIIITEDVPRDKRAKLWALDQTPFDVTVYMDCDTEVEHEDIQKIFDQLPEDLDVIFTANRSYNAAITKLSDTEEMTEHCGLFVYRNNEQTLKLMRAWYDEYWKQNEPDWDAKHYPKSALQWDTFTMWRLLNHFDFGVKTGRFSHPDARWNFVSGYKKEELAGTPVVVYHYTIPHNLLD
jgi:hypothetical protein